MSRLKKIFIVLQIFLSILILCWLFSHPYAKAYISKAQTKALYQLVIDKEALFSQLDAESQKNLLSNYENVKQPKKIPYWSELEVFFSEPQTLAALIWVLLSAVVSLLLLLNINKGAMLSWSLPLFGLFVFLIPNPKQNMNPSLFPSQEYVLQNYGAIEANLTPKEKLLNGWHRYLISEWAHEVPNQEKIVFQQQLEKGLFAFNVARLKMIQNSKNGESIFDGFYTSSPIWQRILYFVWNVIFAWVMTRVSKLERASKTSLSLYL